MTKLILITFFVAFVPACSKKTSALDACQKLVSAGIAANCHETKPGGLGAAATERAEFDLPSVPGKGGSAYRFESEDAYEGAVKSFEAAAMLAGPHRYGSKNARIFVQMNEGLSLEDGKKAKAVVEAL